MISYELAKQLKDAGFPQTDHEDDFIEDAFHDVYVSKPTLEELIEACGGKNIKIGSDFKGNWVAYSYINAISGNGSTPTEAVARLWLALNKEPNGN